MSALVEMANAVSTCARLEKVSEKVIISSMKS